MGLGHPLSKVYLRRPRRALSGDFFVIARRILSSPIYLIVLGDPCSGEIRMRYRYSDWSAESSNLNWSTGARDLKWLETSYCGTLFMGTPFMWTKFLIAVHYVLCKDPGTLFHRFTWKDFIFLIKNFHVQPDHRCLRYFLFMYAFSLVLCHTRKFLKSGVEVDYNFGYWHKS